MKNNFDVIGAALQDYWNDGEWEDIVVHSSIDGRDVLPLDYLFRSLSSMPELEKLALSRCRGRVLDIGAGAGSHVLALEAMGLEVVAIDVSEGAVAVMKARGVKEVIHASILELKNRTFDTLLLQMNGIGIVGMLSQLSIYLSHFKSLLNPDGRVILDSGNIIDLFQEEDGSLWINLNQAYYGEVTYQMEYKGQKGEAFPWLYVDFDTLQKTAEPLGFECKKIMELEEDGSYLAVLQLGSPQKAHKTAK